VIDLAIKEMSLEEKYDKLLDQYALDTAMNYVLHKEAGTMDKRNDMMLKVWKKMLPRFAGTTIKVMKTIVPGRTFKNLVNGFVSYSQSTNPLSNLEVTWVSDREALIRTKDCVELQRMRDMAKKAGLNLDPKEICENDSKIMPAMFEGFGVDVTYELEENGCVARAKLK
jgi:primosomal replication protein N